MLRLESYEIFMKKKHVFEGISLKFVSSQRYTPSQQGAAFNSGAKQRVIRLVEAQRDPMSPPR